MTSPNTNKNNPSHFTHAPVLFPLQSGGWLGMDVLEWLEQLATDCERHEVLTGQRTVFMPLNPLRFGVGKVSSKTLAIETRPPPVTKKDHNLSTPDNKKKRRAVTVTPDRIPSMLAIPDIVGLDGSSLSTNPKSPPVVIYTPPQKKMRKSSTVTTEPTVVSPVPSDSPPARNVFEPIMIEDDEPLGVSWDLDHIFGGGDKKAKAYHDKIKQQVETLEALPHVDRVRPSYTRVQRYLVECAESVHDQATNPPNERHKMLNSVYQETTEKLKALIEMTSKIDKVRHSSFATHMNDWMKDNWTNPYPDEEHFEDVSRRCNISRTMVNNWLINVRTRKWRPAVQQAFGNTSRPPELLLEDSIAIYEGSPLCDYKRTPAPSRPYQHHPLKKEES